MAKISHDTVNVVADELIKLSEELLVIAGLRSDDAHYVAWHLVETNLRGTDSHGVARLPHYVRRLRNGSIAPKAAITAKTLSPSLAVVDGGHGMGHLVMRRAADEASALARSSGAGWVAVRNSSHCGALAPIGIHLANQNMIAIVVTHVDPMVLPYGSKEPFCGTNPLCIALPGEGGKSVCLDMATSVVPWNLIANAAIEGVPIPNDWAVDIDGKATTDPRKATGIHAFGGYKGSGLGIMIDLLCSMLSDSPYGPDIPKMYYDMESHRRLGGLVGAISISHFINPQRFKERVLEFVTRLGNLPPASDHTEVLFPGEPELRSKRLRERQGIPLGLNTLRELNKLAADVGVEQLLCYPTTTARSIPSTR